MKRDMDIVKRVLLAIEEKYVDVALHDGELGIEDLGLEVVAYHCDILYEHGLISTYKPYYVGDGIYAFGVGRLTWDGHDFLDKIRDESNWERIKKAINDNKLPMTIEVVKDVAKAFIAEGIKSLTGNI